MIDQFNPMRVKDERKSLELEPIETVRRTLTRGINSGSSRATSHSRSNASSYGRSYGSLQMISKAEGFSNTVSSSDVNGMSSGIATGETLLPSGEVIEVAHETSGASNSFVSGEAFTIAESATRGEGTSESSSSTESTGTQHGMSFGYNEAQTESWSIVPFFEYIKRWVVSSRTFQSLEEFLTVALQAVKAQPRGHFVIKVPGEKAVFVRARFIRKPWVSQAFCARALERIRCALASTPRHAPRGGVAIRTQIPDRFPVPITYQLEAPMLEFRDPPPSFREDE